ncbi:hypothetical protein AB1Y20_023272 [Prymnesium parvum]|uniref:Uncharacterized protein n=1 Tax=Prymnesium parvum TaxID=97485 RepID=A0AB34JDF0_PRYPA
MSDTARNGSRTNSTPRATPRKGSRTEAVGWTHSDAHDEEAEIQELRSLLGGSRDSPLSVGLYTRYANAEHNRAVVRDMRDEKERRRWEKLQHDAEFHESLQLRRQRMLEAKARSRAAQRTVAYQHRAQGDTVREETDHIKREVEEVKQEFIESLKERYQEARTLKARIDASGIVLDRRRTSVADKATRMQAVRERQRKDQEIVKAKAASVRLSKAQDAAARRPPVQKQDHPDEVPRRRGSHGINAPAPTAALHSPAPSARSSSPGRRATTYDENNDPRERAMYARIEAQRRLDEESRAEQIAALRMSILQSRVNGMKAREEVKRLNRIEALKIHAQMKEPTQKHLQLYEEKKQRADAVYRRRYVSAEKAAAFASSDMRHLIAMDSEAEEAIARANEELRRRIAWARPRSDYDSPSEDEDGREAVATGFRYLERDNGLNQSIRTWENDRFKQPTAYFLEQENARLREQLSSIISLTAGSVTDERFRDIQEELARTNKDARMVSIELPDETEDDSQDADTMDNSIADVLVGQKIGRRIV